MYKTQRQKRRESRELSYKIVFYSTLGLGIVIVIIKVLQFFGI